MLDIPASEIPEGSDYQLVAKSVCGDESLGDVAKMEKNGWRAVPKGRHPKLKSTDPKFIVDGGLVLMERPKFLTEKAREWEQNKADAQVIEAIGKLAAFDDAMVVFRQRPLNVNASPVRRTTVKEFFVKHLWQTRVWFRNLFQRG